MKWEYMTVNVEYGSVVRVNDKKFRETRLHEFLNDVGQQGWEVCGFTAETFILKRPLP